jgi:type IX secretion system PorP/SprF family membrane protein
MLSIDAPILRFTSGAGLLMVNDNIGAQNNLQILGSYAYHLAVGKGKLSFGLRAGIYSQTIDYDKYRYIDRNDPLLLQGKESQVRPDAAVGIFYKAEKYYGGVSLNHIIKSKFDFGIPSDSVRGSLENNMVITGGYLYELNYEFTLRPSLIVKTDFNTYSFDVTLLGIYQEKLWFGLSYRLGEAMVGMIGYKFLKDKSLKLGYAMDYVIQAQAAKQKTSQEFMLSYTLPTISGGGKKVVRTPRFRH